MRSRKIFYNILIFVIFIGLFSSCSYKENQLSQKYNKSVMVKGNAVINVKPDTAILQLSINTTGTNIIDIQSENNNTTDNMVDRIVKLGVDKKDIYKSYCNLDTFEFDNTSNNLSETSNYTLSTTISVKVRDINKIEEILNEAIKDGVYRDYDIKFTVSNYDKYYKEALKKAIEDGNNKAKTISKNLGVDLGSAVKIDEDDDYTDDNENNNFTNVNYEEKSNGISGENILIQASVNMTFEY